MHNEGKYAILYSEEVKRMDIPLNATLRLKKAHPCGGTHFKVLRTGMDIRIQCRTCGREVLVPRHKLEKNIKTIEVTDV